MKNEKVIIIGGGPCGLAAAISLQDIGIIPLVIEKGNVVNTLYHFPTHQTFFSTSEKLEIGDMPFITENRKPVRNQALSYYREVALRKQIRINAFEKVLKVIKKDEHLFSVVTDKQEYEAKFVVIATGYYDHPNFLNIPGEHLEKVFHYFKEAHPFFDKDVIVIGGKNSAIDASLELAKAKARVTVLYRGEKYSPSIKPWVLPEFEALVRNGTINMEFQAVVKKIEEDKVIYDGCGIEKCVQNDFVFAMTGYHPDHQFIKDIGVVIDNETGRPYFHPETMETNIKGVFIAGVLAAGNDANEIFIENGRFHGGLIANYLKGFTNSTPNQGGKSSTD